MEQKRDLLYSIESVLLIPFLYMTFVRSSDGSKPMDQIIANRLIPYDTVLYILLSELLKTSIAVFFTPSSKLAETDNSTLYMSAGSKMSRLPTYRRDSAVGRNGGSKISELFGGMLNFFGASVVCHILIILLGAPLIEDCILTFQFSLILTSWLVFPLFMVIKPSHLFMDLPMINMWNSDNPTAFRAKWRFIITTVGAWAGAAVMPLDWDRPWQRWPIPCIFSAVVAHNVINISYVALLTYKMYGHKLKEWCTWRKKATAIKVKNF